MSESFPTFNEHTPSPSGEFVDIRKTKMWRDFLANMFLAENALELFHDPNDAEALKLMETCANELTQQFGAEYLDQPSRVVGMAFSDEEPDEETPFDVQSAIFKGCNLMLVGDRWQGVLEFECDGSEAGTIEDTYYVPIDLRHLSELRILPDLEGLVTIQELITQQAEAAQAQTISEEFTRLPVTEQRELLKSLCTEADDNLPYSVKCNDVLVQCSAYYTVYDDMPNVDIIDTKTDRSLDENADLLYPEGVIEPFAYPELASLPADKPLTPWDFTLGAGAPCMVLRHHGSRRKFYIPLHEVEDIL